MTTPPTSRLFDPTLAAALRLAAWFALAKLLLQLALTFWTTHIGYSYFRDEFYYIACGRHLAWGYVDHGPLVAVQARVGELLFGDSVFALRILSAVAGAGMVLLCGLASWAMGGRRPAQSLAMLCLICTPQFVGTDGFLSMNSFEPVFWTACVVALLFMLRGGSQGLWWPVLGVSAGLGLLNKPSMATFLIALGLGLLCTPERRLLTSRWAALGILLLLLIPLPYIVWQVHHHWPMLEFIANGKRLGKNVAVPFLPFLGTQIMDMHPVNALLWIAGVVALLRARSIARARWLGLTYLFFFAMMFALHAKDYYLAGIYPALFAAGAVAWEHRFAHTRLVRQERVIAFPLYIGIVVLTTAIILPMASPVLRPEPWLRYTQALHLTHPEQEQFNTALLPQFYADRFGWQQEIDLVTAAYSSLPPAAKAQACVFTANYGEAGALEFLAPLQGKPVPPVISGHNNYWLWGPRGCNGQVLLAVVGDAPEALGAKYEQVKIVGRLNNPWSMPFEHRNIYLLTHRRSFAPVNWRDEKFFY